MKVLTGKSLKYFGFSLMRERNRFVEIFLGSRALLFQSTIDLFTPNGSSPERALTRLLGELEFPQPIHTLNLRFRFCGRC